MHHFDKWRNILQVAPTEDTVCGVIRDYLAAIDPAALALIPNDCKQAIQADDVQVAAVTLLHAELMHRGDASVDELLHEIAHTFAAASVRISRLRGQAAMVPRD